MSSRIHDSLPGAGTNSDQTPRNGEFINYYDGESIWSSCEMNGIHVDPVIGVI